MIRALLRLLGINRPERTETHIRADEAIRKADRVVEEFKRTERAMRGPRVP